jgi:hypothetical protein
MHADTYRMVSSRLTPFWLELLTTVVLLPSTTCPARQVQSREARLEMQPVPERVLLRRWHALSALCKLQDHQGL